MVSWYQTYAPRFQQTPDVNPLTGQSLGRSPDPRAPLASLYPTAAAMAPASRAQQAAVFVTPNTPETQAAVERAALPPGANPMRLALAKQMMATGSSTAPVQSPLEGLARALQGGIGGYMAGQENRADEARQAALGGRLAELYGIDPAAVEGLTPGQVAAYGEGEAKKAADAAAARQAAAEKGFDQEKGLRKEFSDLSKTYREQRGAYNRIAKSAEDPSGAGDIALIFNYMKLLDPGSVVRESEFSLAQHAGSFGENVQAAVARVVSGKRLTPQQRADFVDRAGRIYGGALDTQRGLEEEYRELAGQYDVNADRVVRDYVRGLEPAEVTQVSVEAEEVETPEGVEATVTAEEAPEPTVYAPKTAEDYADIPEGARYQHPDDPIGQYRVRGPK